MFVLQCVTVSMVFEKLINVSTLIVADNKIIFSFGILFIIFFNNINKNQRPQIFRAPHRSIYNQCF